MTDLTARLAALGIEVPELGEYAAAAGPTTGSYVDRRWADAALAALVAVVEVKEDVRLRTLESLERVMAERDRIRDLFIGAHPFPDAPFAGLTTAERKRLYDNAKEAIAERDRLKWMLETLIEDTFERSWNMKESCRADLERRWQERER